MIEKVQVNCDTSVRQIQYLMKLY